MTFPSWNPQRSIDHILVSPRMDIAELGALPVRFSDHRPLAMRLNLNGAVELPEHSHSNQHKQ
jgi:endonuclease/exonuclease/phosphatase family metal-dependent hydrolase